jgi:tight adherence protein C
MALAACGVAYVLPSMVLARLAKRRQHRIRMGLPDALDLLVVSVEAGLGLDQALQRVGEELAFAHKDL